MFEFIQRFFGAPSSSATAKERLRLVLLSDHLSLAPDVVEALKRDLLEVISRYVEVDAEHCDVTFEQREKQVAMRADIPILGMSRPTPPAPPPAPPPPGRDSEATPSLDLGAATASVAADYEGTIDSTPISPSQPASANGHRPTRRKRRKGMSGSPAAQAT